MGESQEDSMAEERRPEKQQIEEARRSMSVFDGAIQVLAAIPALAIVGYCVGTIVFGVKLADGGLPVMSVLETISARQLLMTGAGAIVPISFVYLLLGATGSFVAGSMWGSEGEKPKGLSKTLRNKLPGTRWVPLFRKSLTARILAAVLVLSSALFLPVGWILGFGILGVTMVGFSTYVYFMENSGGRRTGEQLVVLLLCIFLTGLGAGIFAIGIRGPQFPVAERTVPGQTSFETVGLLGTNGSSATVVTCVKKDGFSEDPRILIVKASQLEITSDEFHLNPRTKTSLFQIITGWSFGLNDQTRNVDDVLCGGQRKRRISPCQRLTSTNVRHHH